MDGAQETLEPRCLKINLPLKPQLLWPTGFSQIIHLQVTERVRQYRP